MTRLERRDGYLWAQLPKRGLWLWGGLIVSRLVITGIAHAAGAHVAAGTAAILLMLGLNRAAQALVVVPRAIAAGIPFAPEKDGTVFGASWFARTDRPRGLSDGVQLVEAVGSRRRPERCWRRGSGGCAAAVFVLVAAVVLSAHGQIAAGIAELAIAAAALIGWWASDRLPAAVGGAVAVRLPDGDHRGRWLCRRLSSRHQRAGAGDRQHAGRRRRSAARARCWSCSSPACSRSRSARSATATRISARCSGIRRCWRGWPWLGRYRRAYRTQTEQAEALLAETRRAQFEAERAAALDGALADRPRDPRRARSLARRARDPAAGRGGDAVRAPRHRPRAALAGQRAAARRRGADRDPARGAGAANRRAAAAAGAGRAGRRPSRRADGQRRALRARPGRRPGAAAGRPGGGHQRRQARRRQPATIALEYTRRGRRAAGRERARRTPWRSSIPTPPADTVLPECTSGCG